MVKSLSTSKGKVIVRIATPEDAQALFTLRLEALAAHPDAFAADVEMTRARGVDAWTRDITSKAEEQSGVVVLATAGEELIGMAGVGRGHWPKTRHTAIVYGVYIKHEWRGLGIAGAILDEFIRWSGKHGIVVLKLGVVTSNQAAIHCYQRAGFTTYGTEPKSHYIDGIYYDEFLMARFI